MKRVLIAGATGYLGKYVVKEFKENGYWIKTIVRNIEKLEDIKANIDESCTAELTSPQSLEGICENIDVVFSSVGITKQKDGLTYTAVDYQANKNLLDEAKKSGVKKFIFISVFGAKKLTQLKAIQAKIKFEEELKNSGLDYTIVYPNGFFSDMLEYLKMAKKGKGYVFGDGNFRINPIHGKDLAAVCVDAANKDIKEIDVGGPDIFTHNDILKIAFDIYGKKAKISKVPVWLNEVMIKLLRIFTSVKTYGPLEFFMTVLSRDMVATSYGSRHLKEFYLENKNKID